MKWIRLHLRNVVASPYTLPRYRVGTVLYVIKMHGIEDSRDCNGLPTTTNAICVREESRRFRTSTPPLNALRFLIGQPYAADHILVCQSMPQQAVA